MGINVNVNQLEGKEVWIDVLRAFACACVLLVHSPAKYDGCIQGQYILAPANYVLMACGVSVFFMISGALLFSKPQKLIPFYKKRFSRILWPVVIWSLIYIFYNKLFVPNDKSLINQILMIPFTNQTGLLWFMYTLVGIYLVIPIISQWLNVSTKKEVQIVLGLWGVTLFLPYIKLLDSSCVDIISTNGALHSFSGFLGYALLGYYLRHYVTLSIYSIKFILLVAISFLFPLFVFFCKILPVDVLNGSMSISSVLMSTTAFLFFKDLKYKDGRFLRGVMLFAQYSFGIYLSHMLFLTPLRICLTRYHIHYAIQIPITALLVGIASFSFIWLLSHIPKSKYLLG